MNKREAFEKQKEKETTELDTDLSKHPMMCNQNHSKEIDIWERSFPEKIQIVKEFKTKGNDYFKEDDMDKACYFYAQALLQFHYIIPDTKEQDVEVADLNRDCHLNQAMCYYKLKRWDEGLSECY